VEGVLTGLARWPVKSMGGEALAAARLDWRGVAGDRAHALLDRREGREGRWLTVRQAPRLLAWSATYPDAPDGRLDPTDPPPPRLRAPDGTAWDWDDPGLDEALAAEALGRPLELRRFRTNLHLELDAAAFAEERWEGGRLRVGEVTLAFAHPCARCVIPTRDPDDLSRWPELPRWLHRRHGGLFGINARVVAGGRVRVGDPVTVEEPATPAEPRPAADWDVAPRGGLGGSSLAPQQNRGPS